MLHCCTQLRPRPAAAEHRLHPPCPRCYPVQVTGIVGQMLGAQGGMQ